MLHSGTLKAPSIKKLTFHIIFNYFFYYDIRAGWRLGSSRNTLRLYHRKCFFHWSTSHFFVNTTFTFKSLYVTFSTKYWKYSLYQCLSIAAWHIFFIVQDMIVLPITFTVFGKNIISGDINIILPVFRKARVKAEVLLRMYLNYVKKTSRNTWLKSHVTLFNTKTMKK